MMNESDHESPNGTPPNAAGLLTNMPFASNAAFATQRGLLESIRDRLLESRRLAITGTPSRPRTQCQTEFAVEVAHLCRGDFDSVWWIPGGCAAAVPGLFASIAFPLDLPEAESGVQDVMTAAVRNRLAHDSRCLLVFDSVIHPQAVDALIPEDADACVLMTSYQDNWPAPENAVPIPDLRTDESHAFLAARLGKISNAVDEECAFHLGGVPLLLHLYAGCSRIAPLRKEALRRALVQLSEEPASVGGANIGFCLDHLLKGILAAFWETENLAASLFALSGFMGPQPIYASMLLDGVMHLPQPLNLGLTDKKIFQALVDVMSSAGLAQAGRSAFAVPALLQERFVSVLPADKKQPWCDAALSFMASVFPFKEEHKQFDVLCTRLLGHASAVATWAEHLGCSLDNAGRLLNQVGLYLRACGQGEEAIKYYLHAIACGEMVEGADHPKVAVRINNLGVVYRETGRLDEAREAFRRAIRIIKDAYGPADHMLAMAMRNLVTVAEDSKDEREMERTYRRALRVYADALGQTHPYVHECLYSLGRILGKRGDGKGARRCFEEALRCALLSSPPNEKAIALYSRNLGRSLLRAGEAGAALEHLQTCVALQRKLNHPAGEPLAESLYELGNAYRIERRYPEARKSLEEALMICRAASANNQMQVRILAQLARVLSAQGDPFGAAKCYEQICRMQEEAGGAENPELVSSLMDCGDALELSGNLTGAQACFVRALELEQKLATKKVRIGTLQYRTGAVNRALGDHEKALEGFKAAMTADMREHGSRHPDVARDLLGMGLVYRDMGDTARAVGNVMKSLSIYEECLGKYHAQTIEARSTLEALGSGEEI